jgi:menaquinone-specific isochorismate synthase
VEQLPAPSAPIQIIKRIDRPSRSDWIQAVDKALAEIQSGRLKKVVLARETTLHLTTAPDPFSLASALQSKTEGASLFCVQIEPGKAFLGATPERLFQRKQNSIATEAVAATRKRSIEFIPTEKERLEFQLVQDYLAETLAPYCTAPLQFTSLSVHKTANVQHLYSRGTAILATNIESELLSALHPTPALCGAPKQKAFDWIAQTEPFKRQFYGGYIGWTTPDESDWMVSIRSCQLEGKTAKLYTGTGIVAGSNPEAEWEELEAKLSLYKDLFLWKS